MALNKNVHLDNKDNGCFHVKKKTFFSQLMNLINIYWIRHEAPELIYYLGILCM
jgi:hypothetical protein